MGRLPYCVNISLILASHMLRHPWASVEECLRVVLCVGCGIYTCDVMCGMWYLYVWCYVWDVVFISLHVMLCVGCGIYTCGVICGMWYLYV